jgi:hypothetical protein
MDALLSIPVAYRWIATLAFIGVIIALSVTPGVERPDDNLFSWLYINTSTPVQKALHIIAYAVLAGLWMWTLAGITSTPVRLAISFVLSLCLGVALEWYQTTVPGRYGTITDVILNTIGTIGGLILAVLLL